MGGSCNAGRLAFGRAVGESDRLTLTVRRVTRNLCVSAACLKGHLLELSRLGFKQMPCWSGGFAKDSATPCRAGPARVFRLAWGRATLYTLAILRALPQCRTSGLPPAV